MKTPRATRRIEQAFLWGICWMCSVAQAESKPITTLVDESNDDVGPGSYTYPTNPDIPPGALDLRKVELRAEREELVVQVTLGAPVRKPQQVRRTDARPLPLENGIYVQNVDIYLDIVPNRGWVQAIPGRNVRFSEDQAWDVAIVLTPLPFEAASIVRSALPEAEGAIFFPSNVVAHGATVEARIPLASLSHVPSSTTGIQVLVTGALWSQTAGAMDRLIGRHEANALTMPVTTLPENNAFGGGALGRRHPPVLDLLSPPGLSQTQILGGYSDTSLALVPMIQSGRTLEPKTPANIDRPKSLSKVASVADEKIVIAPPGALNTWDFADVLDPDGRPIARVLVNRVYPDFALATAVEGLDRIQVGAAILPFVSQGVSP